eukprot:COSAG01_NODE_1866_length_9033_cov_5.018359_9_plen_100_part_00
MGCAQRGGAAAGRPGSGGGGAGMGAGATAGLGTGGATAVARTARRLDVKLRPSRCTSKNNITGIIYIIIKIYICGLNLLFALWLASSPTEKQQHTLKYR